MLDIRGQVKLNTLEDSEMRLEAPKLEGYREMEQESLPGIEVGLGGRGEYPFERVKREEDDLGVQESFPFKGDVSYPYNVYNTYLAERGDLSKEELKGWRKRFREVLESEGMSIRKLPSPNYFKEMGELDLCKFFICEESSRGEALRDLKLYNESGIDPEDYLLDYESKGFMKAGEVKVLYNKFRDLYVKYYRALSEIWRDYDRVINPYVYLKRLEGYSLEDLIKNLYNLIRLGIVYSYSKELVNGERYWDFDYIYGNELRDPHKLVKLMEGMSKFLESYNIRRESLLILEESWGKVVRDYDFRGIKFLEGSGAKDKIIEDVMLLLKLFDTRYNIRDLYSRLGDFELFLSNIFRYGINKRVNEGINNDPRMKEFEVKYDKIKNDLYEDRLEVIRGSKDFGELVRNVSEYFDLGKAEKLFKMGFWEGDFGDFVEDVLSRVKFLSINSFRRGEDDAVDLYLSLGREPTEGEVRDYLEVSIVEDISKRLSKVLLGYNYYGNISEDGEIRGVRDLMKEILVKVGDSDLVRKYLNSYVKGKDYDGLKKLLLNNYLMNQLKLGVLISDYFGVSDVNQFKKLVNDLWGIYEKLSLSDFESDDLEDLILYSLDGLGTVKRDLGNLNLLLEFIHNNAKGIDLGVVKGMIKNPNMNNLGKMNLVSKFFNLMVRIIGQGGVSNLLREKGEYIDEMVDRGLLGEDIEDKFEIFSKLVSGGIEIRPSGVNFDKIKDLILSLDSDLSMILDYEGLREYYNVASNNLKDERLYDLDLEIGGKLRFRVLRDLDVEHFRVGRETDCCQTFGGVGEAAMIDSFINPRAGVLVLEAKVSGDWELVGQSYFHYIEGEGYILDNIELNPRFVKDGFGEVFGISVEELYGYWAREKARDLGVKYIQAGRGYSKVNVDSFDSIEMGRDPRTFSVDSPYRDWKEGESNIDLTRPRFDFRYLEGDNFNEIGKESSTFYLMTI